MLVSLYHYLIFFKIEYDVDLLMSPVSPVFHTVETVRIVLIYLYNTY